ncbi:MAG TPA: ubiquitin-like domain-containing protein [Microlunatus sp.]
MRKIIPVVAVGVAALSVAGATFAYAVLDKDVSLSVDGATTEVNTMAGTVGQVLQSKGIEVGEHDVVAPAPSTTIVDGTRIAVQYGRQITVTVDGRPRTYWTTATNVNQALAALNLDLPGAQLSTSRSTSIGRQGLAVALATQKTVTVSDAGAKRRLRTTARTVGAALASAKITVDADDKLSTSPNTPLTDGATLSITRVDVKKVTTKKKVGYSTRYKNTDNLDEGDTKTRTDGKAGVRTLVHTEVRHNGKLASRKQVSAKVTTTPRTKVVLRGTREPEPEPRNEPAKNNDENNDDNNNDTSNGNDNSSNDTGGSSSGGTGGDRSTAFITGYTWWDNSPPGSAQIARPVLHQRAGGKGTYSDPITVAVASGRFSFGTRFYLPKLNKYFIVEDICGACGRSRSGAAYTLDIWLDGRNLSSGGATRCSYGVTGNTPSIKNPNRGLPVDAGSVC